MTAVSDRQTVGELMTGDPVVATIEMPLAEAAAIMDFYRLSGLPVIDSEGSLIGVVSQTDLLHARTTEPLWRVWQGLAVRHVMTSPAVTVTPGVSIDDAARLMAERGIHRLVVTSSDGVTPIGVLSVSDLVRSLAESGED
jgi:CBS domain-containing protein